MELSDSRIEIISLPLSLLYARAVNLLVSKGMLFVLFLKRSLMEMEFCLIMRMVWNKCFEPVVIPCSLFSGLPGMVLFSDFKSLIISFNKTTCSSFVSTASEKSSFYRGVAIEIP